MTILTLDDIVQARVRIQNQAVATPLIDVVLPGMKSMLKVKPEHLQPTGSFKIRGAANCVALLMGEGKRCGVIAYSTGNHAQAVALAAKVVGMDATIVMSADVPRHKVEKTEHLGARVLMAEPTSEARRHLAEQCAREDGLILIPPYDDLTVMAGQGTIGLEILDEGVPSTVYVPVGGGGLIAGVAAAIKQREPLVRIVGVEPMEENDTFRSWSAGQRIGLPGPSASIADAIKVQIPGEKTFPIIQRYVDDMVLVNDGQIVNAMRVYFRQTGYRLEPAGAAALAAAIELRDTVSAVGQVVCIGTGQNITGDRFKQLVGM